MKTIKKIIVCLLLSISFQYLSGQEVKVNISSTNIKTIKIAEVGDNIEIMSHSGSEVIIRTNAEFKIPERAKGLKHITVGGAVDNTGIGIEAKETDNVLFLNSAHPQTGKSDYTILIPKDKRLSIEAKRFMTSGSIKVSDITTEIEVNSQIKPVILNNVTGPLVVNTLSSSIDVKFAKLNQNAPINISTTSGDIDISLPSDSNANLSCKTLSGGTYSDFEFKSEQKTNSNHNFAYGIHKSNVLKINSGGVEIKLSSVSGNIFIRKK